MGKPECAAKQKRRASELVAALALVGAKLDPVLRRANGYGFIDHVKGDSAHTVAVCRAYGLEAIGGKDAFTAFQAKEFFETFDDDIGWPKLRLPTYATNNNE